MKVWKKLLSSLLSAALLASLLCAPALGADTPVIRVSSEECAAGENAEVTISLENNPGFINMTLDVWYDDSVMTLVSVEDTGALNGPMHSDNLSLCPYRLAWNDDTAANNMTANGAVVTLTFAVREGAANGSYPVTVSYEDIGDAIYDVDLSPVEFSIENGSVTLACAHQTELQNQKEPTCTEDGYTGDLVCSICGEVLSRGETIPATGHQYGSAWEYDETNHWHVCTACGDQTGTAQHSWSEWEITKPATETEEGEKTRSCTVCGAVQTAQIPTLTHTHTLVLVGAEAAACTEAGCITHYECTGCGRLFQDAEGTQELTAEEVTIPAAGHKPEAMPGKEATCTESGLTEGSVCSVCGEVLVEQETIPAQGHTWGAWTVTQPATDTTEGSRSRTCSVCGVTQTEVIPPLSASSGGSDSQSVYPVVVPSQVENGTLTVNRKTASRGAAVMITAVPDSGYELAALTVTDDDGHEIDWKQTNDNKYTFTMPRGRVFVDVRFAPVAGRQDGFRDVAAGTYYHDAVLWAAENGITSGTSNSTFDPNGSCTRAQIVTFLWRANGSPAPRSTVNPFTDVSSNAYYYEAVLWAVEEGITSGTTATTFSPNSGCTRAQAAAFLWRAEGSPAASGSSFSDVADDAYYAGAVDWAVANGVTLGTTATTFSPNSGCTRAQIVTFLYRTMA